MKSIRNPYLRIGAHSISGGAMEGIREGHIEHGLLVGFASSGGGELLSKYGGSLTYAEQVAANAVLGGVVSELGGGKFANGAMTAAYTMMFNDLAHKKRHILFMRSKKYKSTHPQWRKEIRKQAFEYMIDYSNKTGNEIAAVVLENGYILVFDPTGNDQTNSNNYFYDNKSDECTFVNINGHAERVAYQVHTHPFTSSNIHNPLRISFEDIGMADRRFGGTVHVLVLPGAYYKVHTNQLNIPEGPIKWR